MMLGMNFMHQEDIVNRHQWFPLGITKTGWKCLKCGLKIFSSIEKQNLDVTNTECVYD